MTILLSILLFIFILGFLVLIHEFGHFIAAKAFGITVTEFGLGFPPRAWGRKIGGTIYSLNWIPVGGFVSIEGEDDQSLLKPGSFASVNRFKRAVVLSAGVAMNFLVAVVLFSIVFMQGVEVPTNRVRIDEVASGSPAQTVGLAVGDEVTSAAGTAVSNIPELQQIIQSHLGKVMTLTVSRGGKAITLTLTPRQNPPVGQGAVGVALGVVTEKKSYPFYQAPIEGTKYALDQLGTTISYLVTSIAAIPSGTSKIGEQISGPVGVAYVTYRVLQIDPGFLLQLAALISLSLALVNILPLPALDGGRLAFVLLSALFRRDFYPKLERTIHQVGLLVLLAIFVVITYNDLARIVSSTSLGARLHEIFNFLP